MTLKLLDKTFLIVIAVWTVVVCGASMAYQEYRDNIYFTAYIEEKYILKTDHEGVAELAKMNETQIAFTAIDTMQALGVTREEGVKRLKANAHAEGMKMGVEGVIDRHPNIRLVTLQETLDRMGYELYWEVREKGD